MFQISTSRGRPPGLAAGISGSSSSHWSEVRLLAYALLMALRVLYVVFTAYVLRAFFTAHFSNVLLLSLMLAICAKTSKACSNPFWGVSVIEGNLVQREACYSSNLFSRPNRLNILDEVIKDIKLSSWAIFFAQPTAAVTPEDEYEPFFFATVGKSYHPRTIWPCSRSFPSYKTVNSFKERNIIFAMTDKRKSSIRTLFFCSDA